MNIQQYKYVLAVVELKNFEAAAEKCFVTQSTLSTMIRKFEDEIGIKIFNRKTKPVSITKEGLQIISRLRIITNEINNLEYLFQEIKGVMVGELNIGVIPTIAPDLIPMFFNEFISEFPNMKISIEEMTTSRIEKSLLSKDIDIGIVALPLENKSLKETTLYSEPFLIYDCRKEKYSREVLVSELDYKNLSLLEEGHCLRSQVLNICELSSKHSSEKTNYEFKSGSLDSLLKITQSQNALTIVPFLFANNLDQDHAKRVIKFAPPIPVREVGMVTHTDFVKKIVLEKLKLIIQKSVNKLLPVVDKKIEIPIL